jgi:hypothetical protein
MTRADLRGSWHAKDHITTSNACATCTICMRLQRHGSTWMQADGND